eukprot:SAG31_NODE_40167_length_282_cov_1.420765_1_plen_22_part_01
MKIYGTKFSTYVDRYVRTYSCT